MARANVHSYTDLGKNGGTRQKSARIANSSRSSSRSRTGSSQSQNGARGGGRTAYPDWRKEDLVKRARELGISGRSSMSKSQLVGALRKH